jgi:hypothetical protein
MPVHLSRSTVHLITQQQAQVTPAASSVATEEHPLLQEEDLLPEDDFLEEETTVGEQALAAAQAEATGCHEPQKEAVKESNRNAEKEVEQKRPRPNQPAFQSVAEVRRTAKESEKRAEDSRPSNRGLDRRDSYERRHERERGQDTRSVEHREERSSRNLGRVEERPRRDSVREWDRGKRGREDWEHEERRGSDGGGQLGRGSKEEGSHGGRYRSHADEPERHSAFGSEGGESDRRDAGLRVEVGEPSSADPVSPSPRTRLRSAVVVTEDANKIKQGSSLLFRNALKGSVVMSGTDVGRGAKPKTVQENGSTQRKRGATSELRKETPVAPNEQRAGLDRPNKRGSIFDRIQPLAGASAEEQVEAPSTAFPVVGNKVDKGHERLPVLARLGGCIIEVLL